MLIFPDINPVILKIGSIAIHWYGVLYLCGFIFGIILCNTRSKRSDLYDICFYIALGIIFGGRLGMVFYEPDLLFNNPVSLLQFWQPGRSFHGGLLGVIFALYIYSKLNKLSFWQITDCIAPVIPVAIACGRLGNFINGELWGRVTTVPWAMVFPHVDNIPRHPSQLYELLLEGVLLFIILWRYSSTPKPTGKVTGLFLLGYGVARIFIELFREPDIHLGFVVSDYITMGQLLSIPMIILGVWLLCKNT